MFNVGDIVKCTCGSHSCIFTSPSKVLGSKTLHDGCNLILVEHLEQMITTFIDSRWLIKCKRIPINAKRMVKGSRHG